MAPPLNATSSADPTPPRAASATRALARTDTFIPMKPAAPEKAPPMAKPIAVSMLSAIASRTTSTTATIADDLVLAGQVGLRALLHRSGDVLHLLVAR